LESDVHNFTFVDLVPGARYDIEVIGKTNVLSSPPGRLVDETGKFLLKSNLTTLHFFI